MHVCMYIANARTDRTPSKSYFHRCVPTTAVTAANVMSNINAEGVWSHLSSDIITCWRDIIYLCLIACGQCRVPSWNLC